MELDKELVRDTILKIPGVSEAMRNNNYTEAFKLCKTREYKSQLAAALIGAKVNFLNHMSEIPSGLFRGNKTLFSITIPGNIKKIGDYAFLECENLKDVTIEEGVEEIGEAAFSQTKIREIHLPKSITSLGELSCGRAKVYCFLTPEQVDLSRPATVNEMINEETNEVLNRPNNED